VVMQVVVETRLLTRISNVPIFTVAMGRSVCEFVLSVGRGSTMTDLVESPRACQ
jgi:hypothetical protein